MKEKVNVAVIGLGGRSLGMLQLILNMSEDVKIVGLSDVYEDRLAKAVKAVEDAGQPTPMACTDYKELFSLKDLDAVYTPTSWTSHVEICLECMEHGIYVGTEVGGATSIQQCWELVRTSERTGIPCMLMENCCYGRDEMMVLNMVKKGLFGECVHAEGGYRHDLRHEVNKGIENRHYRLENYANRGGDVYPTHALGPISKWLGINRGNRMVTLTAMASKACGLNVWRKDHMADKEPKTWRLGDVITTTIKCANGETITLFHDTSLPRPYSRAGLLQGTRGIWSEDRQGIAIEDGSEPVEDLDHYEEYGAHFWQPAKDVYEKYDHPLWSAYEKQGVKEGHGGMDWLVLRGFFNAVRKHEQTPIDVYDTASWMAITVLSEQSADMGGMPVAIPDFTDGKFFTRQDVVEGPYSLDILPQKLDPKDF